MLERQHDYFDVIEAVTWARQAGFDNLNLDLIFGLPEDSYAGFRESIDTVLKFSPNHIHIFPLAIMPGGSLMTRTSHARSRRLVTSFRSGPTSRPPRSGKNCRRAISAWRTA